MHDFNPQPSYVLSVPLGYEYCRSEFTSDLLEFHIVLKKVS